MNQSYKDFSEKISTIVQPKYFLSNPQDTIFYRKGIRIGQGLASAVISPGTLLELWKVIDICTSYNKIIIMQAANTGLTGGSTPDGNSYDREIIIINTLRINSLILINNGNQVIAFPGTTLYQLEERLNPIKRSPHSVIGSSCIGASVIGGICNNSGGNLVNRGPAYTELALYARLNTNKELELVNHLGIDLGCSPEEIISNLQDINFDINKIPESNHLASDMEYIERVRDVNASTPARYNADSRRLYEASGCAGKIAVFAVRLDTFQKPKEQKVFFVGTNDPENFNKLRRKILTDFKRLPDMGEYMHRSYFDGSDKYCKDTFSIIKYFGTSFLPKLLFLKRKIDSILSNISFVPSQIPDRFLQCFFSISPNHLPNRIREYRNRFEHYLLIQASDDCIRDVDKVLIQATKNKDDYEYIKCSDSEGKDLLLHRYVAGSAPMRYGLIKSDSAGELLPLDVALPRNFDHWHTIFPDEITSQMSEFFRMGHFFCMVFHWDIILKKGVDSFEIKNQILKILDNHGAKYPAEHNVGNIYKAEKVLASFYSNLDPTNSFNAGIGKASKNINYS